MQLINILRKEKINYDKNSIKYCNFDKIILFGKYNKLQCFVKIFVNKNAKVFHLEAKSTNLKFEFEKCRNWHWMWSKVYFNKKYSNFFVITLKFIPELIIIFIKFLLYFLVMKNKKSTIYYYRMSGMFNALVGKTSWYRPNLIES